MSKIFSLFQLDLMNLFKLNKDLAVKLNQSLDTLYNLEYMEYSLLVNIINEETEEQNKEIDMQNQINSQGGSYQVGLPSHLKPK
jgi:hypothetical protein